MGKINEYTSLVLDKIVFYLPKVVLSAFLLWIGFFLIKKITKLVQKNLEKYGFTNNTAPFIVSAFNISLKFGLIFFIASILGADLTGLIAILAAAGFAIGMALQGSLGNFASGILILGFKPFKTNDWISINDDFGKVIEIGIFNTKMITRDHSTLIIPNSIITDSVLTNYSLNGTRRVEILIPIPYIESFPRVKKLILEELLKIPVILKNPTPIIEIENYDTHSVILAVRPYAKPDEYWQAMRETKSTIKTLFHKNNIQIAYVEGYELGDIGE